MRNHGYRPQRRRFPVAPYQRPERYAAETFLGASLLSAWFAFMRGLGYGLARAIWRGR